MNIFYDFNDSQVVTVEELPWTGNLKAGTPVDENGAVANDATAIGILAEDVSLPFGRKIAADRSYFVNAKVVKGGFIDKARAEEHCGITYANSLIEALTDIHFVDAFDPEFPGSGGSGSGLPDPSTLNDGTAMVAVDGEWKMQDGYGYTESGEQTVITWDGNTEGRETLMPDEPLYKVSDNGVPVSLLIGATVVFAGQEVIITQDMITEIMDGVVSVDEAVVSVVDTVEIEGITINKGIYFIKVGDDKYVSSLTYGGDVVHKIDQKYLPNSRPMVEVKWQNNTYDEVLEILNSGLMPYMQLSINWRGARLYVSSVHQEKIYFGSPTFMPFFNEENPSSFYSENFSTYVDKDGWGDIVQSNSVSFQNQPYNDGTYVLTCTRINGSDSFTWEPTT